MSTICINLEGFTGIVLSVLLFYSLIYFLLLVAIVVVSRKMKSKMRKLKYQLDKLQEQDYDDILLPVPISTRMGHDSIPVPSKENNLNHSEPESAPVENSHRAELTVVCEYQPSSPPDVNISLDEPEYAPVQKNIQNDSDDLMMVYNVAYGN